MARTHLIRRTVAGCAAGVLVALPGAAQAGLVSGIADAALPACGALSQPFAQFGDRASYYAVANQGFESGAAGWTLSGGATVVAGNEPWYASGSGAHALSLPPGSSATSPASCISLLGPHIRLFAAAGGADRSLLVQVLFRGATGNLLGVLNYGSFSPGDYPAWTPSAEVPSLLALPLLTTSVQVRFTSAATSGAWKIDDLYIDPLKMV